MKRKRAIKLMMSASGTGNRAVCADALDGFKEGINVGNQPAAAYLITRAAYRSMQFHDMRLFLRCKKALKRMGVYLEIETE